MNPFFERIETLIGENNFEKLSNETVAIVGVGGVGGTSIMTLARCGVGTLIIQDFDVVCESNFNRQVVANIDTLGKNKVDAMEEIILKINPKCKVIKLNEKFDSNSKLFSYDFNYLIDAIDSVNDKLLLIKTCLEKNINFISSMGTAKKFDIKKLEITIINKTSYDPLAKVIRKRLRENNINNSFMVLSSTEEPKKSDCLGSYMPVTSTAGMMLADYIIKKIIEI